MAKNLSHVDYLTSTPRCHSFKVTKRSGETFHHSPARWCGDEKVKNRKSKKSSGLERVYVLLRYRTVFSSSIASLQEKRCGASRLKKGTFGDSKRRGTQKAGGVRVLSFSWEKKKKKE